LLNIDELGIFDGDGHVMEETAGIIALLPDGYSDTISLKGIADNVGGLFPGSPPSGVVLARPPEGSSERSGPEGWATFMDDLKIQSAVLYPTVGLSHGFIVDLDMAIATARAYNDWLASRYLPDRRLKGMALIPLQEPDAAVDELRRAVTELGFLGGVLPATGPKMHLGAKQFWPIYEEASRLECPLAVHGGIHTGIGLETVNVYAMHNALGHPISQALAFGAMIYNGIFDRYPNLRVAYLEGGLGWVFMVLERLSASYKAFIPFDPRKEYIQLDPNESVSDYIVKRIEEGRITFGIEGDEPALSAAISLVGETPFMFSSDFPHEVNRATIRHELEELLEADNVSDSAKVGILRDNARRFYRC
jgi:predicted TIM-barrel fold metal-dependent hydrolase